MDLIATIGPSSWDREVIAAHLRLGVKCIRFPFSKLRPDDHVARCRLVRDIADALGVGVLTMADIPGGKPRLNANGPVDVESGRPYRIALGRARCDADDFWLDPGLPAVSFRSGDQIFIGDGENRFTVCETSADRLIGTFATPGRMEWRRAFIPIGMDLQVPTFTERDKAYAAFAHAARFDWVALSFVSSSEDVLAARAWLLEHLDWAPCLVAKIETMAAVRNVDAIARTADAVMIARGDLALQIGFAALWSAQKSIIDACARAGTYCIAATGFLESLASHPTPTRAECIDFCSTLAMGAPAILFTTETSIGKNPIVVIETALRLAESWTHSCGDTRQALHAV